jgi:hypothetical protein
MPQTLPIEIHHLLEDKIGREEANRVASAIVLGFEAVEQRAEAVALQKKLELLDELRRELASKSDLQTLQVKIEGAIQTLRTEVKGDIQTLRTEMESATRVLRAEMQTLKTDLEGKIQMLKIALEGKMETFKIALEGKMDALTLRFNFMIVLIIIALTLMNPVAADLIRSYINK